MYIEVGLTPKPLMVVLLHSCKSSTKSTRICDIHAEHLLSIPINPESVSHWWIALGACAFVVVFTLKLLLLQVVVLL